MFCLPDKKMTNSIIATYSKVLASKETQAGELRKTLGIGLGQQITKKFETIASSET